MRIIDLTGERFGLLTVIERAGTDKNNNTKWKCKCDCGSILDVYSTNLRSGRTKSCGCIRKIKDITGQKFGRLTVLERAGYYRNGKAMWKCKCDCETIKDVAYYCLVSGQTKSCGCLKKEKTFNNVYKKYDLTGEKIGDLTVIEMDHKDRFRNTYWRCRNNNGDIFILSRQALNYTKKKMRVGKL